MDGQMGPPRNVIERRGLDLSWMPEEEKVVLSRVMWLEDERERLLGAVQGALGVITTQTAISYERKLELIQKSLQAAVDWKDEWAQ